MFNIITIFLLDLAEKNPLNEQIYIPCPIQEPETETLAAPELGCTETIPAKIKEDEKQMRWLEHFCKYPIFRVQLLKIPV